MAIIPVLMILHHLFFYVDYDKTDPSTFNSPNCSFANFSIIFVCSCIWAYYFLSHFFYNKTIGDRVVGIKLVSLEGGNPKIEQVFIRTLLFFTPLSLLSQGGNKEPVFFHERLSKTRMIEK